MSYIKARFAAVFAAALCASAAVSAPVLTNGGFEANPPTANGNNQNHPITPWVLGGGDKANVVKVDGPGGYDYSNNGPESDASAPGAGIDQHYLDIVGRNNFYQVFTPLCTGDVSFGAYFSSRGNSSGTGGMQILLDADASVVAPRQAVTVPSGSSKTDPWLLSTGSATLTANTAYRFLIDMNNNLNVDNAFVEFETNCPQHSDTATITKTCEVTPPVLLPGTASTSANCDITVTVPPAQNTNNPRFYFVEDILTAPDGTVDASVITSLTAAGFDCVPSAVPYASAHVPTCMIAAADMPASGTITIPVEMTLPLGAEPTQWENCARLSQLDYPTETNTTNGDIHAAWGADDIGPFKEDLGESCAVLDLPKKDDDDVTTGPLQCTPFTHDVVCNENVGAWEVTLNSTAAGFDPTDLSVSTSTPGITVNASSTQPNVFQIYGANSGDLITVMTDAIDEGAGGNGLDLCCLGEVEIQIPQGQTCEPRQPVLEIDKTCETEPTQNYDAFCEFSVYYEGPPPTSSNPIVVTDDFQTPGWTYAGLTRNDPEWSCNPSSGGYTGPAPVSCSVSDTGQTGDWITYTSSFQLAYDTSSEEFRNCGTASLIGPDGQPLEAEDCFSNGDHDLKIEKDLVGESCEPGRPCEFTYTVTNEGAGDYSGPITLLDEVSVNGNAPAGSFMSITPALCPVTDLTSAAGCTGIADVPAGGSVTYTVEYLAPSVVAGADLAEGVNCVSLLDEGMTPEADPREDPRKHACAEFEIGEPTLSFVKKMVSCDIPGTCVFDLTLTNTGADFDGNILLVEGLSAQSSSITSISPLPVGCTLSNLVQCVTAVNLPSGGSATWTVTTDIEALYNDDHDQNCGFAYVMPSSLSEGDMDTQNPPSDAAHATDDWMIGGNCVPLIESDGPSETVDLALEKIETSGSRASPVFELRPIVASGSLQAGDVVTITDDLTANGLWFTQYGGSSAWSCSDMAGVISCTSTVGANGVLDMGPIIINGIHPAIWDRNCADVSITRGGQTVAEVDVTNNRSCVTANTNDEGDLGLPLPPRVDLIKTCQGAIGAANAPGPRSCAIKVSASDLPPGRTVRITDDMLSGGQSFDGQVNVIVAQAAGWTCSTPIYSATNKPFCEISSDALEAQGGEATLLVSVSLTQEFLAGDAPQNCAFAELNGARLGDVSCAAFPQGPKIEDTPLDGPMIELSKVATGNCSVNEAARQYTCGFDITVTNTGDAPFAGPMVLDDTFGTPKPRSIDLLSGDGWACARSDGLGTSCLNQQLTLAPGENSTLSMELVLPGQARGGQFVNCVAQGLGGSDFLQATLIQTLLNARGIDVGKVDGAPGQRTRAGIRQLQQELGLEPNGQITAELFEALGLSANVDADPACATVDLDPIRENCSAGQKRNSAGECYTPEVVCKRGEVKNSKGQCYTPDRSCPKGQKKNSKGKCYKPDVSCGAGQKKNSKGQCYTPKPLKCDARTTVDTGEGCRCRYKGMRKTSAQRCVCRNTGLPSVPGIGCPSIKIDKPRETDGAAATESTCRIKVNGICLK